MPNTTPPASRLLGGVELHVMVHQRDKSDAARRSATLLVNFVDTVETGETLDMVLDSLDHVRHSSRLFSGANGVTKLLDFLRKKKFSTVDAVLLMTSNAPIEATSAQAVVQAIRTLADGLVVIVDEDCSRWAGLHGVSGFVRSAQTTSAFAAASLARCLAALRIPFKFIGPEPDDVIHSFGSASEPAVLLEAIYFGADGKVKFAHKGDAKQARAATNVTAIITATNMRFFGRATNTVRAALSAECQFTFQAPKSPTIAPLVRERIALLQLICNNNL